MKLILKNLGKVLSKPSSLVATVLSIVTIGSVIIYFSNSGLVIGNMGYNFFIIELVLNILIAILFGLFIGSTVYKILYFATHKKRNLGVGGFASLFGILVGGCPACSITLASYLGLSGIISVFPFSGIELKVLSLIMLLYVVYDTSKTLEVCSLKNKKTLFF